MHCRTHGRKPALALWMLVAAVDLVILVATVGLPVMSLIVVLLAVLVGGTVAARRLSRRAEVPAKVARRRA